MNQEKIGKFIVELRKEKKLTQEQLAERIGVTDRAISKWENGRGMPDLSLLKPLCDELGITINELLSGERLNKEIYQERLEENIINTISYSDKKIKNTTRIFRLIIVSIILLLAIIITLFCIDISKMRNNQPVLFSTWGFKYAPAIDIKFEEIENVVKEYLVEKGDNEFKHHDNEKTFVSMNIYLCEEKEKLTYFNIYAWVLEEKYYLENNSVKQDSSSFIPYKFVVEKIDEEYVVTDSRIPRDGSYYLDDMKNIFPRSVRNDMDKVHTDGTIERLQLDIEQQIKLYFHK